MKIKSNRRPQFILCLLFIFVGYASLLAQPAARLIVRGDDMGYTHSGNEALMKCYTDGFEKSIEVIVPSPWYPEAVQLLKQIPNADVGIHLALTSEWDNVKWRPLTNCSSLTDARGYFLPMVFPNKNYPGRSIRENKWKIEDVEKEFRAQIEMAKRDIPQLTHISGHMGCTSLSEEVRALAKKLSGEYGLEVDLSEQDVQSISYRGPKQTAAEKIQSFMNMLDSLQPGKTYLFVDHPGLDNEELRAVHHIGYEDVAEDRQGVTDLFTSKKVMDYIRKKNIQIISYKDLWAASAAK